jgi:hypothetical protein
VMHAPALESSHQRLYRRPLAANAIEDRWHADGIQPPVLALAPALDSSCSTPSRSR